MTKPDRATLTFHYQLLFSKTSEMQKLRNVFFISNMTKAIELLEELLSSKLNLKITLLISVEAVSHIDNLSKKICGWQKPFFLKKIRTGDVGKYSCLEKCNQSEKK